MMMSRKEIGMAKNKSKTGVLFTRTDAASQNVLFLFDSDFPPLKIDEKGIRTTWVDMISAARLWYTRSRDSEKNEFVINPHDHCGSIGSDVRTNSPNG